MNWRNSFWEGEKLNANIYFTFKQKVLSCHVNKGFTLYLFVDSSSRNKEDKDCRYSPHRTV